MVSQLHKLCTKHKPNLGSVPRVDFEILQLGLVNAAFTGLGKKVGPGLRDSRNLGTTF